jgi:nicotinate-nucleotide adenylyltransferase
MPSNEFDLLFKPARIAFYGGSFDPVHLGHIAIAKRLCQVFDLDEFVFIPAFHAPHKKRAAPTPALDRFSMLALATNDENNISISKIEMEVPNKPYTVETLTRLNELLPDEQLFFVMGADSWRDIRTWREWERVLTLTNHIVVTRPGYEINTEHLTREIGEMVVDVRGQGEVVTGSDSGKKIYITDAVNVDIAAVEIRKKIREGDDTWHDDVTLEVAKYIEKYQIYS